MIEGDAVWKAGEDGRYSKDLLTAALSRSDTPQGQTVTDGRTQDLVATGELPKLVEESRGLLHRIPRRPEGHLLMLNGAVKDFNFAARVKGSRQMQSTQFLLTPEPNVTYSACLMHKVEEMFETGSGALSGGADAAGQRHAGKLPDVEGAGSRAAGDAAPECRLQGAAAIAVRAGCSLCDSTDERFSKSRAPGLRPSAAALGRRSGRCARKLPHGARRRSHCRPEERVLVQRAPRHGGPQLSGSTDSRSAHGHPFAVERSESLPAVHLPVRRAQLEAKSQSCRRDRAVVELGCCRSLHRLRLRTHRPLQGTPGVAAERVGRPGHRSRQSEDASLG